ncbi:RNA methyltransferase PUA domain-containing protein [Candidatus Epulonipiscium viviparus]|uniref:RNA methyltransferase PUA domain-containing protein n=1 Tax=Candidatus Epulonipiscium viviparus TaxID=420336 RepID=UPI0027380C92|nr:RNA methyltransferase PUA domain-containing protein [Candidatus Epulopiscium viviparus]
MPKYFVDKSNIKDATIVIEDRNFHHIKNVMRAKIGDQLQHGWEVVEVTEKNEWVALAMRDVNA